MIIPANTPKAFIGIKGLKILAIKATAVVLEVTAIALTALLQAYAILLDLVLRIAGATVSLYLHASKNTKILSAATPKTMNTVKVCKLLK